ncbi:hypothetical protein GGR57DRAFT_465984 [Xylariaceae sp. FL1272]|nr:hypothetical protein GGR57DRAFT_465984 [Xylariaceae sp. FL1272]
MAGPVVPSAEEIAYYEAHADDNIVPNIIACATVAAIGATVFILLRLWSRRIHHGRLKLDISDYLALAAWFLYIPYNIFFGLITRYGAGRHIIFVTNPRLLQIFSIIDETLYALVLALLKFSILSLYRQIFGNNKAIYIWTWALTAVVAAWSLQIIFSTNFQCVPISASWDVTQQGRCINYGVEALVAYITDIITDLTILSMPIPVLRKLNVSKSKKRMLMIVFAAGGSACIVSIVQLAYITKLGSTADPSWDNIPSAFLANTEILIGFLATSVATYRPFYQFMFNKGKEKSSSAYTVSDNIRPKDGHSTIISSDRRQRSANSNNDYGIMVTDEIELLEHGP